MAKFFRYHCEFQDLISGKTSGNAKECDGLYYFNNDQNVNKQALVSSSGSVSVSNFNKIMLWHNRLGHPSFPYLKRLFPSLFRNKNVDVFHCEICQIAKQTRVPYPIQPYKISQPFSLVHSDIGGFQGFITL